MSDTPNGPVLVKSRSSRRPPEERRRAAAEQRRKGPTRVDTLNLLDQLARSRRSTMVQVTAAKALLEGIDAKPREGTGGAPEAALPPWVRKVPA